MRLAGGWPHFLLAFAWESNQQSSLTILGTELKKKVHLLKIVQSNFEH